MSRISDHSTESDDAFTFAALSGSVRTLLYLLVRRTRVVRYLYRAMATDETNAVTQFFVHNKLELFLFIQLRLTVRNRPPGRIYEEALGEAIKNFVTAKPGPVLLRDVCFDQVDWRQVAVEVSYEHLSFMREDDESGD
jgi:hypothetical protein